MQNQKVTRGGGDQHFGTVWCQPHSHQKTGVKKLLVGTSILCAPGQQDKHRRGLWSAPAQGLDHVHKSPGCAQHHSFCSPHNPFFEHFIYVFILLFNEMGEVTHSYNYNDEDRTFLGRTTFWHVSKRSSFLAIYYYQRGDACSW